MDSGPNAVSQFVDSRWADALVAVFLVVMLLSALDTVSAGNSNVATSLMYPLRDACESYHMIGAPQCDFGRFSMR